MILLLGANGYIGSAFAAELTQRGKAYLTIRREYYTDQQCFASLLDDRTAGPITLVINCAAWIPQPSVNQCSVGTESMQKTIDANLLLPTMLAAECEKADIEFAHISTACLYDEKRPYSENDAPTRDSRGYCGFYVATKYLSEQTVLEYPKSYVWRIRLPFDRPNNPRNYLTKLATYPELWDHINSLTHRGDFVKAALDMIELKAAYGVYNMVNPGSISARAIVDILHRAGIRKNKPKWVDGPVTGTRLNTEKLLSTGVKIRLVGDALHDCITQWDHNV